MENEKRMIDANALLEKAHWIIRSDGTRVFAIHAEDVDDAPTVDAVEVVRCKDCKHWNEQDNIFSGCRCTCWKGIWDYTKPDDFCSYGERRTDNERKAD